MIINEKSLRRLIKSVLLTEVRKDKTTVGPVNRFAKDKTGKYLDPDAAFGTKKGVLPMKSVTEGYTEETYPLKLLDGLSSLVMQFKNAIFESKGISVSVDEIYRLPINNEKQILEYIYSPEGLACLEYFYPPHIRKLEGDLIAATYDSLKRNRKQLPTTEEEKFFRDTIFLNVARAIIKYYFHLKYDF
jgi:hypothetical protein